MPKSSETTLVAPAPTADLATWQSKGFPKNLKFGDFAKQLSDSGDLIDGSEFGSGFTILDTKDKGRLVGVPMIILDYNFNEGDNGQFVSLMVVTNAEEKLIVNDGSSGIARQILDINSQLGESETNKAIFVKHGLRRSDYEYEERDPKTGEKTGAKKPATTYYLDI